MLKSVAKLTSRIKGDYAVYNGVDAYLVFGKSEFTNLRDGETPIDRLKATHPGRSHFYKRTAKGWELVTD